ncbi:MAG: hypothetical protein J07HQW1_00905 [Haloquadratum walsbyi J07HQW1]|uniref:Uncharacterized protein n=1 Tax=Haloquadratum walsbyi J07HQW1 TaxID=1238424 RepID=U1PBG0_9EURY|nr:MAG: hypothetical protein J07HQW1_00905 [Haloquadratum walsbyi J07HQW1]
MTTAASGLSGSVEGQADVRAEQALTVTDVSVSGDQDARFAWTSDDDTSFQVAVELSDGDGVLFDATLENSAVGELTGKVTVDAPDVIDVDVRNNESVDDDRTEDLDPGDGRANRNAVQTGDGTFVTRLVMLVLTVLQDL